MNFEGFYSGKKVLVTGHTGFKGSWLTEWLLMMGAKVTGFALAPNTEPALFDQLGLAERCDHRIGDIRDRALVRKVIHEIRPDVIFHLAAQPLVRASYAQPIETYETNVMGTAHVLDALRNADWPCAAVMITTDKVYENKEWLHAYRESDPLGGYDPYSSSKACAELVIQSYRQSFFNPAKIQEMFEQKHTKSTKEDKCITAGGGGKNPPLCASWPSVQNLPLVAVASARAGNVIGGGDWAQDRIVPDCMRALAKGEIIQVRNPHATRPWQHVLEPLSGYLLLGMKLFEALDEKGETLDVRRETLDVKCETLDVRRETRDEGSSLNTSPLTSNASHFTSPVSHLPSHISHLTSNASHLTSNISHLTSPVSHLTSYSSAFNFGPALASNRSVREMVEKILAHWPGEWKDCSEAGALHEAGKLNLATDKTFHELGWRSLWGFERTVCETVKWYKDVRDKGVGMVSELTRKQIADYTCTQRGCS